MSAELLAAPAWVPSPALPGAWTFWADLAVGFAPLGPVQPLAFSYTSKLSDFGTADVTMPAGGDVLGPDRMRRLWSWRLWAFYNGVPVWCGCPTGIRDEGGGAVALTFAELPGYLRKRVLDAAVSYTATEQTWIGYQIAQVAADLGVTVQTNSAPGLVRDRNYATLEGPTRADLLINLSQVLTGPQFRTYYRIVEGLPQCYLMIAHPSRFGQDTGLGVQVPGSGLAYSAQWDSDSMRTRTFAVGDAGSGSTQPVVTVDAPQADLPRLDQADDWPGVVLTSTLTERANAMSQMGGAPQLQLTATAPVSDPDITTYNVGDAVTVSITSPLMPGGLTATGQLGQLTVDAAKGTAAWTVLLSLPPPRVRPTVAGRIQYLTANLAGVFRRILPASV